MARVDLYENGSPSYGSGAISNGQGVGFKHLSTPFFSTYAQNSNMPNGIGPATTAYANFPGCWYDGSYLYFFYRDAGGLGRGVYRFSVNTTPEKPTMTYDSFVGINSMLTGANIQTPWTAATYRTGKVVLHGYMSSGTGNTPVVGQWSDSSWPFSAVNADWLSPVAQSYLSYVAGQITNYAMVHVGASNAYLSSANSGQVHILSLADGSIVGNWVYYAAYSGTFSRFFQILGEVGGKPCGGNTFATGSLGNLTKWDISSPSAWTEDTILLTNSQYNAYQNSGHQFNRATRSMSGVYKQWEPLSRYEMDLLGFSSDMIAWWSGAIWTPGMSPPSLLTLDTSTDEYLERKYFPCSYNDCGQSFEYDKIKEFVQIDGIPWFLCQSYFDQRMEGENPGGSTVNNIGLRGFPIGPIQVEYTVPSSAGLPRYLTVRQDGSATDFGFACHDSKHRFAVQKNGGAWSAWRSGKRQLTNLDITVDGIPAWPSFVGTDTIKIRHQICTGWPYNWGNARGNAGESGAPTSPLLISGDIGIPRNIRAIFDYDAEELGGGFG